MLSPNASSHICHLNVELLPRLMKAYSDRSVNILSIKDYVVNSRRSTKADVNDLPFGNVFSSIGNSGGTYGTPQE